jgi:predicted nuclease with TOPRIM domain
MNLVAKVRENKADILSRGKLLLVLAGMLAFLFGTAVLSDTMKQRDALIVVTEELHKTLDDTKVELEDVRVQFTELSSNAEKLSAENQGLKDTNTKLNEEVVPKLQAEVEKLKKTLRTLE